MSHENKRGLDSREPRLCGIVCDRGHVILGSLGVVCSSPAWQKRASCQRDDFLLSVKAPPSSCNCMAMRVNKDQQKRVETLVSSQILPNLGISRQIRRNCTRALNFKAEKKTSSSVFSRQPCLPSTPPPPPPPPLSAPASFPPFPIGQSFRETVRRAEWSGEEKRGKLFCGPPQRDPENGQGSRNPPFSPQESLGPPPRDGGRARPIVRGASFLPLLPAGKERLRRHHPPLPTLFQ